LTSRKQQPLLDTNVEKVWFANNANLAHKGKIEMNSMIYKSFLGAVVAVAGLAASAGTIVGSKHDFSVGAAAGTQICVNCHAPHNANTTVTDAPLWNHTLSTATYTVYTSATMTAKTAVVGQPGTTSKLCLSCHDGTVAVNSFGGATGTTFISAANLLGTALGNDHPIGVAHDVVKDPGLNAVATAVTIGSTTGTLPKTKVGTIASNMLFNGNVECASCHDVHNTYTNGASLVKVSMAASALCTTCHIK
jgi:predicted CXXCH cytochrome family protein